MILHLLDYTRGPTCKTHDMIKVTQEPAAVMTMALTYSFSSPQNLALLCVSNLAVVVLYLVSCDPW